MYFWIQTICFSADRNIIDCPDVCRKSVRQAAGNLSGNQGPMRSDQSNTCWVNMRKGFGYGGKGNDRIIQYCMYCHTAKNLYRPWDCAVSVIRWIPAFLDWCIHPVYECRRNERMDKERNEMKIFSFMFTLFNIHISRTSQVYRIDFLQISLIYVGNLKSGFFPRSLFGLKKLGVL